MFWNQEYAPSLGGVEIYTRNLAKSLIARRYSVCVVASHSSETLPRYEEIEGVPVHRFPFYQALTSRDLDAIAKLQKEVSALKRSFAPDLVHVNFSDASPFFHLRTRQERERFIVVFHNSLDEMPGGIRLASTLVEKAGAVVAPSQFMKDHLVQFLAARPERITVVQNSAREDIFFPAPVPADAEPAFLFAARLVPAKGGAVLIEAARILARAGMRIKIRIAGAGPEKENLKASAAALGIAGRISFEGVLSQAELADAMKKATAVIIPSIILEAAPLISLESALTGKPVIASRIGGLAEIVEDEKTGLLFEPGNASALAAAMARILQDPPLRKRLGEAARARAVENFTLQAMAENYEKLYGCFVASSGDRAPI